MWLNPRAGKMKRILRFDWLPVRARWAHLARSGFPCLFRKKMFSFWPYDKSLIDQAFLVKMAEYWLRSFLRFYWPRLNLANVQSLILTSRLVNIAYMIGTNWLFCPLIRDKKENILFYPYSYHYTARVKRNNCEFPLVSSLMSLEERSLLHLYECWWLWPFKCNLFSSSFGWYQWFSENDGKITFNCWSCALLRVEAKVDKTILYILLMW